MPGTSDGGSRATAGSRVASIIVMSSTGICQMARGDGMAVRRGWRQSTVRIVGVVAVLALAGCGGGGETAVAGQGSAAPVAAGDSASGPCVLDGDTITENNDRLEVLEFGPRDMGEGLEMCAYSAQIEATGTPVTVTVARYNDAELGRGLFDSLPDKGNGGTYDYNGLEVGVGDDQAAVNINGTWYGALWQHDNGSNNGRAAGGILELLIDQLASS